MTRPPLKLKPFNSGCSKDKGEPIIKNKINGTMNINPIELENTGNCWPVLSCLFFAHLFIKKLEIKANTIAINTYENPLSNIGLGEYNPSPLY